MIICKVTRIGIALGILLCLMCGVCIAEQSGYSDYGVFISTQQDFCFLYNIRFRAEWNDTAGAVVYTNSSDDFPRMQLSRTIYGDTTGFAVEEYFYYEIETMKERLGSSLTGIGEYQTYTVSDAQLPGVLYQYTENGRNAALLSLMQDTGESLIKYSCFFYQDDSEPTLQALADTVRTYQPDASYSNVNGVGTPVQTNAPKPTSPKPTQNAPALNLVKYDGGYFSVMLPEGWRIQTMGQYTTFGFRAWDPQNSDYQIFYYGKMNPFLKSEAAKEWNRENAGLSYLNAFYAETIVVEPDDVSMLFTQWNEFATFVANHTGGMFFTPGFSFPSLKNFSAIETIPITTFYASVASAEAIVTGSFQSERGTDCFAKLCASLVPGYPTYYENVDMSSVEAYGVSGVLAPKEGFLAVEQILSEAIYSLDFTQAYVNEANAYTMKTSEAAMAANAELQATYDRYNAAWRSYILEYNVIYSQDGKPYFY